MGGCWSGFPKENTKGDSGPSCPHLTLGAAFLGVESPGQPFWVGEVGKATASWGGALGTRLRPPHCGSLFPGWDEGKVLE